MLLLYLFCFLIVVIFPFLYIGRKYFGDESFCIVADVYVRYWGITWGSWLHCSLMALLISATDSPGVSARIWCRTSRLNKRYALGGRFNRSGSSKRRPGRLCGLAPVKFASASACASAAAEWLATFTIFRVAGIFSKGSCSGRCVVEVWWWWRWWWWWFPIASSSSCSSLSYSSSCSCSPSVSSSSFSSSPPFFSSLLSEVLCGRSRSSSYADWGTVHANIVFANRVVLSLVAELEWWSVLTPPADCGCPGGSDVVTPPILVVWCCLGVSARALLPLYISFCRWLLIMSQHETLSEK